MFSDLGGRIPEMTVDDNAGDKIAGHVDYRAAHIEQPVHA
jgi:hypothetical protein